uniref:protein O-GlcNAcase n=1 Tax=Oncorhynchus mykiss TaxID=8022 RepID=A0A8K9Y405_ONCMY
MDGRSEFLCGVVEGFYGRPWSMEQRKVLFQWMQRWELNTYLYGPKDDLKHRLLWREVYSPEEEGQLHTLIVESEKRGLRFVYSLSPGQDIVFSSSCDLSLLKRKLRQVSKLGCQAFAILFDDIDHSLCQADSQAFSSFAHAQVSVANEIYRFLGEPPVFLFCPTEYCGSLCSPSVSKSPYLMTVGEDLLPNISIIWTGSKVISRELSVEGLSEVQSVLQRPPLVWDNLHANDYDSRRLFLGPFKGRYPQLATQLRGLLLNPNCEFEANYIPLHTLGTCVCVCVCVSNNDVCVSECVFFILFCVFLTMVCVDEEHQYCPEMALSTALHDWMEELSQPLQPGCVCVVLKRSQLSLISTVHPDVDSDLPPPSSPEGEEGVRRGEKEGRSEGGDGEEREKKLHNNQFQQGPGQPRSPGGVLCVEKAPLSESQIRLLVGLHYLPHEHGPSAQRLLQDLTWLKEHCHLVSANDKKGPPQKAEEWRGRAAGFLGVCEEIAALHSSVVSGVSKAVLYDLYPYVWDLRNTALVAKAFICWLGCGTTTGAELLGVESEPWVFKGGVSGELQMLLPIGSNSELFSHPPPLFPTSRLYNIRPYHNKDKAELYCMVRQLQQGAQGSPDSSPAHPDLIGDRCLGPCLALCPEYSMVLEDELGVCGCVLGVVDVRSFAKRCQTCWMPAMRDKYPPRTGHANSQEVLQQMEEDQGEYPDSLLYHFPSQLRLDALPDLVDISVTRCLLTALLTALKANGSHGVFCEMQPTDRMRLDFLTKLGFLEIIRGEARHREGVVLGRLL